MPQAALHSANLLPSKFWDDQRNFTSTPPKQQLPFPLPTHATGNNTTTMPLLRASRLITNSRARLQIIPSPPTTTSSFARRSLSSTAARSAGDHAHEDHYDPPGGWLFGVKPGEKYEKEGWENVWFYGFYGSILFGVVGYCYKPDTRYAISILSPKYLFVV